MDNIQPTPAYTMGEPRSIPITNPIAIGAISSMVQSNMCTGASICLGISIGLTIKTEIKKS
jgi:hypothetical protein